MSSSSSSNVQEEGYPLVGSYGENSNRGGWIFVGVLLFIGWNFMIFSLSVAALSKANDLDSSPIAIDPTITSNVLTAYQAIPKWSAVSLRSDGKIQKGAGTTITNMRNSATFLGVGSQNVKVARFIDQEEADTVVVVWTNNSGSYGALGIISLDQETVNAWYRPTKMPFSTFSDVLLLSDYHILIATDTAIWAAKAVINPPTQMEILTPVSTNYPSDSVWRDIRLTALGAYNFVLSYDTGYIHLNQSTTFGAVAGNVTWNEKDVMTNFLTPVTTWEGGFPVHGIFALDDASFVVTYSTPSERQLACLIGRFSPENVSLTLGRSVVYPNLVPQFYMDTIGLDQSTGLIFAVTNDKDEYALSAILVRRTDYLIDGVEFGELVVVKNGVANNIYADQFKNGNIPFIDASAISSQKAVVTWADFSTNGILTAAFVTLAHASSLQVSPLYAIGEPLSLQQLGNYSVSAAGLAIIQSGRSGAIVIDRKMGETSLTSGSVSLIEMAPKAFGIAVRDAYANQNLEVVVSGLLELPSSSNWPTNLEPGHVYFGLTDGSLVEGPLAGYIDRHTSDYITLPDGTIVTGDSVVGVAIDKRRLYVMPSF